MCSQGRILGQGDRFERTVLNVLRYNELYPPDLYRFVSATSCARWFCGLGPFGRIEDSVAPWGAAPLESAMLV